MCGFVGYLGGDQFGSTNRTLKSMANTIIHRGPDAYGEWFDEKYGIALAHRRLSIIELSEAGAQPMTSACGRYVIAFNGEIYNHLDIRKELKSSGETEEWSGSSDTESLLVGFSKWGIRATVERCIGMFAFAVWDRETNVLTLARDRLGEKPLYYGWQGQGRAASLLFGSELSALKAHPVFTANINRDALCLMMRHSAIAAPHSIYQDIWKLPPGHLLTVSMARKEPIVESYWSLSEVAESGVAAPFRGGDVEAVETLESLLKDAISKQMMADVPLGAFLSGGIDSSTVVALMQAQSSRPIKTFTIGFNEDSYNEAVHARAVAEYLGTDHTELYVTPQQALEVIPQLPRLYSEPFSDSSQIPTYLVSHLAHSEVTVALSGDAGDELFCGYGRYTQAQNLWNKIEHLPPVVRALGASMIRALPAAAWNSLLAPIRFALPTSLQRANVGDKLHKGAALLSARLLDELYLELISNWEPKSLVINGKEPLTHLRGNPLPLQGLDGVQRMMVLDAITYLPDEILVKVDRAAMGVSLEARAPFLDHRVVEFAWRLPQHMKLRDGVGKWVLKQVLYRHIPRELVDRPKMGFGVPIDQWLRGPLRDWAESLLSESRLRQEGFFDPAPIRRKWAEHLSGKRNWQYHLWDVLMFQAWLEKNHSR